MKANELMVGDWVCLPSIMSGDKYPVQVLEIQDDCIKYYGGGKKMMVRFKYVEPIPLTQEILEKNGFEKVFDEDGTECYRYYNSAADGYIKISLYNGGDGDWSIEIVNYEKFDDNKIAYNNNFIFLKVHQLQHALRLCGIEKEIEL